MYNYKSDGRLAPQTSSCYKVAEERWKNFAGFERKVEEETVMKGEDGVVGDILPGETH